MKIVLTLAVLFMTTAIFAQKKSSRQVKEELPRMVSKASMRYDVKGKVVMNSPSCGMHIEAVTKDGVTKLYPNNLPEAFKKDGAPVSFDYGKVDSKVKAGCDAKSVVSVSNVKHRRSLKR